MPTVLPLLLSCCSVSLAGELQKRFEEYWDNTTTGDRGRINDLRAAVLGAKKIMVVHLDRGRILEEEEEATIAADDDDDHCRCGCWRLTIHDDDDEEDDPTERLRRCLLLGDA